MSQSARANTANMCLYERIMSKSHTDGNGLIASRFDLEGVEKNAKMKAPGLETIEDADCEEDAITMTS